MLKGSYKTLGSLSKKLVEKEKKKKKTKIKVSESFLRYAEAQ